MGIENAYKMVVPQEVLDRKAEFFNIFEGQPCWRCGGTGRYSFNLKDMDICYGCGGSGSNITTVGQHAFKLYRSNRIEMVDVSTLRKGDAVEWDEVMIEACTTRTVQSRIISKRTSKKDGHTTLVFHNRKGTHGYGKGMQLGKIDTEVRMVQYRTQGTWMENIVQVSLAETRDIEFDESDIVLFTAKKVPNNLPAQWIVADKLMPSAKTLKVYWDHGYKGKSNPGWRDDWFDLYKPLYAEDINNDASKKWLEQIVKRAKEGRKVYLVCYCGNKSWCHTSLIKTACYDIERESEWVWTCGSETCEAGFTEPSESCMACVNVTSVTRKG